MAMNKLKSRTQQTTINMEILKEDRKMIMNLFIVNDELSIDTSNIICQWIENRPLSLQNKIV